MRLGALYTYWVPLVGNLRFIYSRKFQCLNTKCPLLPYLSDLSNSVSQMVFWQLIFMKSALSVLSEDACSSF